MFLILPETFAIDFDGWCAVGTHYVSIFAMFPFSELGEYSPLLLALRPMGEQDSQNTEEHFDFVQYVLHMLCRSRENFAALLGDCCSTNRAHERRVGWLFVECFSHRFNLAIKDNIRGLAKSVNCRQTVMHKLSYQNSSGEIAKGDCIARQNGQ